MKITNYIFLIFFAFYYSYNAFAESIEGIDTDRPAVNASAQAIGKGYFQGVEHHISKISLSAIRAHLEKIK